MFQSKELVRISPMMKMMNTHPYFNPNNQKSKFMYTNNMVPI